MNTILDNAQNALLDGKLKTAVEILKNSPFCNEFGSLIASANSFLSDKNIGIIDSRDEKVRFAEIVKSILAKITELVPNSSGKDFPPPEDVSVSRLPETSQHLFGREKQIELLDKAWASEGKTTIVSFVAWGGVGKTTLISHWLNRLAQQNYKGAKYVFAWSFYSQGSSEGTQVSADAFFDAAFRFFGVSNIPTSAHERGRELAKIVRKNRCLLILDGLEPLQYPPGVLEGELKDPAMKSFVKEIAAYNTGLCLISTRIAIKNIQPTEGTTTLRIELENLDPLSGAEFLKTIGIKGKEAELLQTATELKGHALSLRLLGNFLLHFCDADIRQRDKMLKLRQDDKHGLRAQQIMESYVRWFEGENAEQQTYKFELAMLNIIGLFDRPVELEVVEELLNKVQFFDTQLIIQNFTLRNAIVHLKELGLLYINQLHQIPLARNLQYLKGLEKVETLDAHPLVREFFGEKLRTTHPTLSQSANLTLYEYYKALPQKLYGKHLPDTLEEMEPLFLAVMHGCRAGKYNEAEFDVYWERIRRKNDDYTFKQLGAFGSALACLSNFFEVLWSKPAESLTEHRKAIVLSWAGFALRALGRLHEAAEPMIVSLQLAVNSEQWESAAKRASNISGLYLTAGDVGNAVKYGQQAVEYADKSGNWEPMVLFRPTYADALHLAGEYAEAKRYFAEAEEMQKKRQPEYHYLYSLQGYRYCDLLLSELPESSKLSGSLRLVCLF